MILILRFAGIDFGRSCVFKDEFMQVYRRYPALVKNIRGAHLTRYYASV